MLKFVDEDGNVKFILNDEDTMPHPIEEKEIEDTNADDDKPDTN